MNKQEDLKTLAANFKKDFENKTQTIGYLTQLVTLLEKYIENPELCFNEPKTKAYFFEEFSMDILQSFAKITLISSQEVRKKCKLH